MQEMTQMKIDAWWAYGSWLDEDSRPHNKGPGHANGSPVLPDLGLICSAKQQQKVFTTWGPSNSSIRLLSQTPCGGHANGSLGGIILIGGIQDSPMCV